jgi:hypothetical protein
VPGQAQREDDAVALDYEYIDSFACYAEIGNNVFDRLAESRREVWFGDDGSGLIRSRRIRSRFFTDEQRRRWQSIPNRSTREATEPSLDRRQLSLKGIHQLCGEALVPSGLRQVFVDLAADLPDACILATRRISSVARASASPASALCSAGLRPRNGDTPGTHARHGLLHRPQAPSRSVARRRRIAGAYTAAPDQPPICSEAMPGDGSWSTLMAAAEADDSEGAAAALATPSPDLNARDELGQTALHIAADRGHDDVVDLLLADPDTAVNARDSLGRSPLVLASLMGHESTVARLLADPRADVNLTDRDGLTPLHWSALLGHLGVVKRLLGATSIDLTARDRSNGRTAAEAADAAGHYAAGELIRAAADK